MPLTLQPFESPLLKVARADEHMASLFGEIDAFLAREPFRLVVETPPEFSDLGSHCWTTRIMEEPPARLATQIGDVAHNLRSALDHLASDLVRLNGGRFDNVYFPFATNAAELDGQIKQKYFQKAAKDVVALLRSIKPYVGGNIALRGLHDLNIKDKHQAIIPAIGKVVISPMTYLREGIRTDIPKWESEFSKDGKVVMVMPPVQNLRVGDIVPAEFSLVFPPLSPFVGEDVIQTLIKLRSSVADTIDDFRSLCNTRPNANTRFDEPHISVGKGLIIASADPQSPAGMEVAKAYAQSGPVTTEELQRLIDVKIVPKGVIRLREK